MKNIGKCCFCGTSIESKDRTFFKSEVEEESLICSVCINICGDALSNYNESNKGINKEDCFDDEEITLEDIEYRLNQQKENRKKDILKMKPSLIKEHFDKYIINQKDAKEKLAVAVYNHFKKSRMNEDYGLKVEKSNILMVGPSGSGKTLFVKTIAEKLGVPYAISDCTSLTSSGYVGDDVETCLKKLIENAEGNVEKAQTGIIFLDEIDKIGRKGENTSITRDVSGEGVQQGLLKMLEGSVVSVPMQGSRKHPQQECYQIDTTNILFICSGAFEGIEKIVERRILKKSKIGFGNNKEDDDKKLNFNDLIKKVTTEDLRKFGMMPELLGRLPVICALEELDKEALVRILTEPVNSIIEQFTNLFSFEGIEIVFDKEFLELIADKAIKEKTGARALRGLMEDSMTRHMYRIPDMCNVKKVRVTKECINKESDPIIMLGE